MYYINRFHEITDAEALTNLETRQLEQASNLYNDRGKAQTVANIYKKIAKLTSEDLVRVEIMVNNAVPKY